MIIRVRNVNGALRDGIRLLGLPAAAEREVRGTKTREWPDPVMTVYQRPQERVLFCPERDANPFFHLFEAVWMLAGRSDVKFVAHIVKRMAAFSDDGFTINGAYGERWRYRWSDQLRELTELLRRDPHTRRAVLQMWCVEDLLNQTSKDIPCNTHVYFKVRDSRLDMTICCRSNDMIWGAYGANAVHFSILQEYIADKIGRAVGQMYQFSDSLHVYTSGGSAEVWEKLRGVAVIADPYADGLSFEPLGANGDAWDEDLGTFFKHFDSGDAKSSFKIHTKWWGGVLWPMWRAWTYRDVGALKDCEAEDWSEAGKAWLERHPKREDK